MAEAVGGEPPAQGRQHDLRLHQQKAGKDGGGRNRTQGLDNRGRIDGKKEPDEEPEAENGCGDAEPGQGNDFRVISIRSVYT